MILRYWLTVLRFFLLGCLGVTVAYSLLSVSLIGWGFIIWGWPGILVTALIVAFPRVSRWATGRKR